MIDSGRRARSPRFNATTSLVVLNVIVYVWQLASGDDFNSTQSLVVHGALYGNWVLAYGQWWRIVTGGFEHGGLAHIAINMFSLFQLGRFVELAMGPQRMLALYLISLVGSGVAVTYFSPSDVTVGASGAIFGLFGGLLAIGVRLGKRGRGLIAQTFPILILNLVFTFAVPFISKAGHVGGLVVGFVAGLALFVMAPAPPTAAVIDTATGEETQAELLPPEEAARPHA